MAPASSVFARTAASLSAALTPATSSGSTRAAPLGSAGRAGVTSGCAHTMSTRFSVSGCIVAPSTEATAFCSFSASSIECTFGSMPSTDPSGMLALSHASRLGTPS